MPAITTFRDLEAWQLGMELAESVYALARRLPRDEQDGLTAQMRRAAVGIPSYVAEGQQQGFDRTYLRHVSVALGSEAELQTQLDLVARLHFVPAEHVQPVSELASRTGQVLRGLQRSLRRRLKDQRPKH